MFVNKKKLNKRGKNQLKCELVQEEIHRNKSSAPSEKKRNSDRKKIETKKSYCVIRKIELN